MCSIDFRFLPALCVCNPLSAVVARMIVSFSKMSLIKNKLRNKMTDARLSALEMLSLESDLLSEVSFETIIEQFATVKSRKKL